MNVDGSTDPVQFSVVVPVGFRLGLTFMTIIVGFPVQEAGDIQMGDFGQLDALANGVKFELFYQKVGLIDATRRAPWRTNLDLIVPSMSRDPLVVYRLDGDAVLLYRYPMAPANIIPAVELLAGDFLRFTVRDDLSKLDAFRVTVFGLLVPDALA